MCWFPCKTTLKQCRVLRLKKHSINRFSTSREYAYSCRLPGFEFVLGGSMLEPRPSWIQKAFLKCTVLSFSCMYIQLKYTKHVEHVVTMGPASRFPKKPSHLCGCFFSFPTSKTTTKMSNHTSPCRGFSSPEVLSLARRASFRVPTVVGRVNAELGFRVGCRRFGGPQQSTATNNPPTPDPRLRWRFSFFFLFAKKMGGGNFT